MYVYDKNETVKRIGKQSATILGNKARHGIHEVLQAYHEHGMVCDMQMAMDLYILGYADGREEPC